MATAPTAEQLQEFMAGPADQPVVMLNILSFKDVADDGRTSGREMVGRYSAAMKRFVEARGATFVLGADIDSQLIGEGGGHFHFVGIMRYPNRQVFLSLASDPEVIRTIDEFRDSGLASQWLFAMTDRADDPGAEPGSDVDPEEAR